MAEGGIEVYLVFFPRLFCYFQIVTALSKVIVEAVFDLLAATEK